MRLGLASMPSPSSRARWEHLAPNATADAPLPGANRDAQEVRARPADPEGAFERARERLWRYDVYRPERLRAIVFAPEEGVAPEGRVAPGSLIVQRIRLGPVAFEAPVRVVDFVDREDASGRAFGYAYATLAGHPERGVARFHLALERASGEVAFRISSWSTTGHWTTRLGKGFARRVQLREVREALARMERVLREQG